MMLPDSLSSDVVFNPLCKNVFQPLNPTGGHGNRKGTG